MILKIKNYSGIISNWHYSKKNYLRIIIMYSHKKHLSQVPQFKKNKKYFRERISEIVKWYDEFTGMDEVRQAQNRVLDEEKNFRVAQEERRNTLQLLKEVQSKIKELHVELEGTTRGDEKYLQLVTQEHKLLKEEKIISENFAQAEKYERESFASLSASVKVSHEKEKAQAERTKYWSLMGSILGTVLGIVGTSINNNFKMKELKKLVINSSDHEIVNNLKNYLEDRDKVLANLTALETISKSNKDRLEVLLNGINSRLNEIEGKLKIIKDIDENSTLKILMDCEDSSKLMAASDKIEQTVKKEFAQSNMLLITMAILSVVIPLVTKFS